MRTNKQRVYIAGRKLGLNATSIRAILRADGWRLGGKRYIILKEFDPVCGWVSIPGRGEVPRDYADDLIKRLPEFVFNFRRAKDAADQIERYEMLIRWNREIIRQAELGVAPAAH